jgi:glycosyltransferase involved in cell wall biosynthesis
MERPALVHTMLFEADIAGRLAASGTGIPVLSSVVNVAYDPVRFRDPHVRRMRLRAARSIDRWTARRLTEHFHAVTETVKESAVTVLRIPPDRVTVIRRGRDPATLGEPGPDRRRRVRGRLGISDDAVVVTAVGRNEYAKGHQDLFESVAPLLREHPRLLVLVVGRAGTHTARLEERHRSLGLGNRVRLLGHRPDVPDLLAASDVFAFPSLYEGFGGSALEAMALGLPVICSDLPALRELVEPDRTALIVPPSSPAPLRAALQRLLADAELRRRLGDRGRRVFLERFTLARSVEGMAALYGRLTGVAQRSEVVG